MGHWHNRRDKNAVTVGLHEEPAAGAGKQLAGRKEHNNNKLTSGCAGTTSEREAIHQK